MNHPTLDERDAAILRERMLMLDSIAGPRVGDYVRFPDGKMLRISYMWDDAFQSSNDGGGWHLGRGCMSYSGGLFPSRPTTQLTRTNETKEGLCWFFHHEYAAAHCGVWTTAPFRVYQCSADNPEWKT